jgi:hypothetical protein
MRAPPRLVDLRIDWLAQYRGETVGSGDPPPPDRLARLDGYLGATRAAFLVDESPDTNAAAVDSWLSRAHAEFPGRVLADPADFVRWEAEPDSLCWAVLALGPGFAADTSQHTPKRLHTLIERGVRVFPFLADHNLEFLERLEEIATGLVRRLAVEVSSASPLQPLDALKRSGHLVPIMTRFPTLDAEALGRLASLGGLVGLSVTALPQALPAIVALPSSDRAALALASDFLAESSIPAALSTAEQIARLMVEHQPDLADDLLTRNATGWISRLLA